MVKYRTEDNFYGELIEPVEVERETASSVWINGRRNAKITDWRCYHDTWGEAKAYLLKLAESKLNSARRSLELAQGTYGNVKGLKQ